MTPEQPLEERMKLIRRMRMEEKAKEETSVPMHTHPLYGEAPASAATISRLDAMRARDATNNEKRVRAAGKSSAFAAAYGAPAAGYIKTPISGMFHEPILASRKPADRIADRIAEYVMVNNGSLVIDSIPDPPWVVEERMARAQEEKKMKELPEMWGAEEDISLCLVNNHAAYDEFYPAVQEAYAALSDTLLGISKKYVRYTNKNMQIKHVNAFNADTNGIRKNVIDGLIRQYLFDELLGGTRLSFPFSQPPSTEEQTVDTPDMNDQITSKTPSRNAPVINRKVEVCGEDISQLPESSLINRIREYKDKIKSLKDLGTESTKIAKNIKDYEEAVALLVVELDSRP